MAVSRIPNAAEGFNPAPDWLGHCPQKVAATIQSACDRNGVSVRRLMLGRKTRAVTRARWEACAELRRMPWGGGVIYGGAQLHPGPSLPQIGLWLHMNHASVLFAVRAVAEGREPRSGKPPRAGVPDDHDRPSPRRGLCSAHVVAEPRCAWRAYS